MFVFAAPTMAASPGTTFMFCLGPNICPLVVAFWVVADHQSLIDLLHLARTTTSDKYLAP